MNKYAAFVVLILVSIGQIAWAPHFSIHGLVLPIVVFYLWLIQHQFDFGILSVFAFVSGIVIDLLGTSVLGIHAFSLLISVGGMQFIEKRMISNLVAARIISLVVSVYTYVVLIDYLTLL